MKKPVLALVCASALALALAACSSPAPAPTPTAATSSSAPSSNPEATSEPVAEAASVVISVEGIALRAANDELLAEFDYFDGDASAAVVALTEAFGSEPSVTQAQAKNQVDTFETSSWPGFTVISFSASPSFPLAPGFRVLASAAELGGVAITTSDGFRVGTPNTDVEARAFQTWVNEGGDPQSSSFLLEQRVVDGVDFAEYEPAALSVSITGSYPQGAVTSILAPSANWGD